jgi:hypothetical protein
MCHFEARMYRKGGGRLYSCMENYVRLYVFDILLRFCLSVKWRVEAKTTLT